MDQDNSGTSSPYSHKQPCSIGLDLLGAEVLWIYEILRLRWHSHQPLTQFATVKGVGAFEQGICRDTEPVAMPTVRVSDFAEDERAGQRPSLWQVNVDAEPVLLSFVGTGPEPDLRPPILWLERGRPFR